MDSTHILGGAATAEDDQRRLAGATGDRPDQRAEGHGARLVSIAVLRKICRAADRRRRPVDGLPLLAGGGSSLTCDHYGAANPDFSGIPSMQFPIGAGCRYRSSVPYLDPGPGLARTKNALAVTIEP